MTGHKGIVAVLPLLVVLMLVGGSVVPQAASSAPADAFYDPPPDIQDRHPGEIIRVEEMRSGSFNTRMWRMLYVSTNSDGESVAVSALLVAPVAPPPEGGYPLVAVGHGSVGIGQECAPSVDPHRPSGSGPSSYDMFVAPLVNAGYVVVMSDYQGLGAPGASSYLLGALEARNVLDSARAAFAFPGITLQPDLLIWGQSQGGHAALFAGELAPTYAPELSVLGVVAEAPAANLETIFARLIEANSRGGTVSLPLMTVAAWAQEYPEIHINALLTPRGKDILYTVVEDTCLVPAFLATLFDRPSDLIRPRALDRISTIVDANTPQFGPYAMPVLIVQGEADDAVPVETTRSFVEGMCRAGTSVTYRAYDGIGHIEVIDAAHADVLSWMEQVSKGNVPSSTCGT
jgi:alpha-beta hydrolase superfamily lysophospholipase